MAPEIANDPALEDLLWSAERIGVGLDLFTRRCGLSANPAGTIAAGAGRRLVDDLETAAAQADVTLLAVSSTFDEAAACLDRSAPMIVHVTSRDAAIFVVATSRRSIVAIDTTGHSRVVDRRAVERVLEAQLSRHSTPYAAIAAALRIEPADIARVDPTPNESRFEAVGWLVDKPQSRSLRSQLADRRFFARALSVVGVHLLQFGTWIASWVLLALLISNPVSNANFLWLWILALASTAVLQGVEVALQEDVALRLGAAIKRALFSHSLRTRSDAVAETGLGAMISRMLEANTFDKLATNGALAVVLASVELIVAIFLLWHAAQVSLLMMALMGFLAVLAYQGVLFIRRLEVWHDLHLAVTAIHTEEMIGHRTRKALLGRVQWFEREDRALSHYLEASTASDHIASRLDLMPRIWLMLAAASVLTMTFFGGDTLGTGNFATLLGLSLLVYATLNSAVAGASQLLQAGISYRRLAPFLRTHEQTDNPGAIAAPPRDPAIPPGSTEIRGLTYRFPGATRPLLDDCRLSLQPGEHAVLRGTSGSGKSTFGAIVSGRRIAEQGLVMVDGLDRHTVGADGWRRLVTYVPQAGDNHVVTDTFAFNLLMGRSWPPSRHDLAAAARIVEELGLGEVLQAMPAGLGQIIGENGWRLSQGERSRVFLARALLQSPSLLIADEVLSALDPQTAHRVLDCIESHSDKLILIAHT